MSMEAILHGEILGLFKIYTSVQIAVHIVDSETLFSTTLVIYHFAAAKLVTVQST